MTVEAKVTWVEDKRFLGQASSGHAIVLDASSDKLAPSPMELMLIGVVGCTAYDLITILGKKRQDVTDMQVSAAAERAEQPPQVYTEIKVHYLVRGRGIKPKAVEDAIRLSAETYCSASAMLEKTAKITTDYRIEEVGEA